MSTSRHMTVICVLAAVFAVIFVCGMLLADAAGAITTGQGKSFGYEDRLFDTSTLHTIDIEMDDWDGFVEACESEEYSPCAITIDGERIDAVGIRGKGNTSLKTVSSLDSDRYSFKVEFDQYSGGVSYHGLDKLSLNNTIQDTTYMKDYLAYRAMAEFGVDAPLCSFARVTVNGEYWGLYLAVEGVEESFLQRNYGSDYGELYKPDSMGFGGGRGNGAGFDMGKFKFDENGDLEMSDDEGEDAADSGEGGSSRSGSGTQMANPSEGAPDSSSSNDGRPDFGGKMPDFDGEMPDFSGEMPDFGGEMPDFGGERPDFNGERPDFGGKAPGFGGMGSDDVKLKYIDDNPESYANIFDNAKTAVSAGDKNRLISSLKQLSSYENLSDIIDIDEVIRYFVVHDFVCNGDSYTGSMIHNYYLYEDDGRLSMIPWDYNLAFGTFQASEDATSTVNSPIDSPVARGDANDRPMVGWIFSSDEYTDLYHSLYAEFLETVDMQALVDEAAALIGPYVQTDPTSFYTYEEFQAGIAALKDFCALRSESVSGQLDGTIPSTSDGQAADSSALVDGSALTISDMGSMGGKGGMGGPGQGFPGQGGPGQGFPGREQRERG